MTAAKLEMPNIPRLEILKVPPYTVLVYKNKIERDLEFLGLKGVLLCLIDEFLGVGGDFIETLGVSREHNWSDKSGASVDGNRDISILESIIFKRK